MPSTINAHIIQNTEKATSTYYKKMKDDTPWCTTLKQIPRFFSIWNHANQCNLENFGLKTPQNGFIPTKSMGRSFCTLPSAKLCTQTQWWINFSFSLKQFVFLAITIIWFKASNHWITKKCGIVDDLWNLHHVWCGSFLLGAGFDRRAGWGWVGPPPPLVQQGGGAPSSCTVAQSRWQNFGPAQNAGLKNIAPPPKNRLEMPFWDTFWAKSCQKMPDFFLFRVSGKALRWKINLLGLLVLPPRIGPDPPSRWGVWLDPPGGGLL